MLFLKLLRCLLKKELANRMPFSFLTIVLHVERPIDGELIDLTLAGQNAGKLSVSDLENLPIITPSGEVVSVGQLARISFISAPQQIRRQDGKSFSLSVSFPQTQSTSVLQVRHSLIRLQSLGYRK